MVAGFSLTKTYLKLVQKNKLIHDPVQLEAITRLHALGAALTEQSTHRSWMARALSAVSRRRSALKGLYLHGSVGVGKTMLMDLFFESIPLERKRRTHFSQFMLDVHSRIHTERLAQPRILPQEQKRTSLASLGTFRRDPLHPVASDISREAELLCFDEFQVTDVADTMIIRGLFTELFRRGVVVVATSNRAPEDLYKHDLQRSSFLPFVPVLRQHCEVYGMTSSSDYRMIAAQHRISTYFNLAEDGAVSAYDQLFMRAARSEGEEARPAKLAFLGRELEVPESSGGVARFSFSELCGGERSTADYLQVCQRYKSVFLSEVPRMGRKDRDPARRFISLVDMLYDSRVYLVMSAQVGMQELFELSGWEIEREVSHTQRQLEDDLQTHGVRVDASSLFTGEEERFAAKRTLSRLRDMQSKRYREETRVQF